jgi:hypothetical protein
MTVEIDCIQGLIKENADLKLKLESAQRDMLDVYNMSFRANEAIALFCAQEHIIEIEAELDALAGYSKDRPRVKRWKEKVLEQARKGKE